MKKSLILVLLLAALLSPAAGEMGSLSHLFLLGRSLKDTDGDGLADKIALTIVIPDNPSSSELALASDIAARANFESLAQDFGLIKRESEVPSLDRVENPILIGTNVKWLRDALKGKDIVLPDLGPNQAVVAIFAAKTQTGLVLAAGSDDALLQAGRAFFLRWPYLWDIWGREEGATYDKLEKDVAQFLTAEGVSLQRTAIRSALYEFPSLKKGQGTLKKLAFNAGEIKDLTIEVYFADDDDLTKTARAVDAVREQHARGQRSEIFSYPGCAQLMFNLRYGRRTVQAVLPRLGYPKRMLTPGFKDAGRADGAGKEFDLTGLFSAKGFYGDMDKDGILDSLDAKVIIPPVGAARGVGPLAAKLMLNTAGAAFPVVYVDREIENRKTLVAPILVGPSALVQELQRTGKLRVPPLEGAWGVAQVVPRAFNKSSALAFLGADAIGLDKILAYFNRTFPYFDESKSGRPQIGDVPADIERFLKGDKGAAEAYFSLALKKALEDIKDRDLESAGVELTLPQPNKKFEEEMRKALAAGVRAESVSVKSATVTDSRRVFEKEQEFPWEGEEAFKTVSEKLQAPSGGTSAGPLRISLGVSESPEVRQKLRKRIEAFCAETLKQPAEVEVLSAYKQGFFWLLEKVIPALKGKPVAQIAIRFAEEKEDFTKPKRFYAEPSRWLQELYPIDEFIARDMGLPLDKIRFELGPAKGPIYAVTALDAKGGVLLQQEFSPRIREIPYLKALPEWGAVRVTTGWARIEQGGQAVLDAPFQTDLERFWDFYQDQVLSPLYAHVMKKTGNDPTFSKQPFFKQLRIELWSSEPDYRLGLDEEIVSSLEAMHDEIYFDTLDFLRGLTELDLEDGELPEDTQRYSAPGSVFPVIHPSTEGGASKVKVTFEDWLASAPQMVLKWKEHGREEVTKRIGFPALKSKPVQLTALIYNGLEERIETLVAELEIEKESDYLTLLDMLASYRDLADKGLLPTGLSYPNLASITFKMSVRDMQREEPVPVIPPPASERPAPAPLAPGAALIDTAAILSPDMVLDAVDRLGRMAPVRAYIGGRSYEKRPVPVLEIFKPFGDAVSIPRLLALKPTLFLSGRQHANEVSSTNYILKLAELLATDKSFQDYANKINFVLEPMENPDGAALAYGLQALTPFHSLHAGRYSALGLDVGAMTGSARPILPEAAVRRTLNAKWSPDIYLNLHGYPSHEWVQQFSNYSPYLFRDFWIPKGWYVLFSGLSLPVYAPYKEAADDLKTFIISEMQSDPRIRDSNRKFYDRYARWAARWQPHSNVLEITDGLNLYAKRRSSTENRLTARRQTTFVDETPELMDETASGAWLDFLSTQGITYLKAHLKYLSQAKFETARVEEESGERVRIQLLRSRPGTIKK